MACPFSKEDLYGKDETEKSKFEKRAAQFHLMLLPGVIFTIIFVMSHGWNEDCVSSFIPLKGFLVIKNGLNLIIYVLINMREQWRR